jgi:anaerobic selenocysteine-containing dehydrogenase
VREIKQSICRSCMAFCPIDVTIEDGRPVAVVGNKAAPIYEGFSCPKGRAIPAGHSAPGRLTHSMIRQPDGSYRPVSSAELIEDIVARLRMILDRHGPRAIATYMGGGSYEHQAVAALLPAFMRAIGSPMMFTAESIDQPGKNIAKALHGVWRGGRTRPETWDAYLLVGGNPVISKQYFGQNPGIQLKRLFKDRAKLIVIDPRRTETARRAHVHLQPYPGEDPTILAGLIHLLITSNRIDRDFVGANADGFDLLAAAVASFTPDYVAHRAGIAEADLRAAADILGGRLRHRDRSEHGTARQPRLLSRRLSANDTRLLGARGRSGRQAARHAATAELRRAAAVAFPGVGLRREIPGPGAAAIDRRATARRIARGDTDHRPRPDPRAVHARRRRDDLAAAGARPSRAGKSRSADRA